MNFFIAHRDKYHKLSSQGEGFSLVMFVLVLVFLIRTPAIRVFPKVDHSGNNPRIVLEQITFSKKSYL